MRLCILSLVLFLCEVMHTYLSFIFSFSGILFFYQNYFKIDFKLVFVIEVMHTFLRFTNISYEFLKNICGLIAFLSFQETYGHASASNALQEKATFKKSPNLQRCGTSCTYTSWTDKWFHVLFIYTLFIIHFCIIFAHIIF